MDRRRTPRKLDPDGLWDYALRILAQRPNSTSEIRQKLSRRADSPTSVTIVLEKLREYGLADDAKFSEAFASARLQNQGFGRMRILRDLRAKRVAGSVAEGAVQKTFAGVDELQLAQQFLERKYRSKGRRDTLAGPKGLAAAYRKLRLAGFSSSASINALKKYSNSAEMLEETPEED